MAIQPNPDRNKEYMYQMWGINELNYRLLDWKN